MLEQQLLDSRVTVLPRRVDSAEAAALSQIRVRSVLERQLHELVAHRLVAGRRSGRVNRRRLNVLVRRERIDVRAAIEQ